MPRSRKSSGTPVVGSSSAARLWEAAKQNFHLSRFPDTTTQGAPGRPCLRLEMAGA